MSLETVTHHGRETAFRQYGERDEEAIVCVHGAAMTGAMWEPLTPIGTDRTLAAIDLSGHGSSEDIVAEPGWETLAAYGSDVEAVLEAVDGRVIVGHALGAAVALHVAERAGHALEALVLIGMGTRLPVARDIFRLVTQDYEALISYLHEPGCLFHEPDGGLARTTREAMRATPARVARRDFQTSHGLGVREMLPEIEVPTLVLCGREDRLTPPRANARLAERLPRGRFTIVEGAAHMPMLEQAEAVNDLLRTFLTDPTAMPIDG